MPSPTNRTLIISEVVASNVYSPRNQLGRIRRRGLIAEGQDERHRQGALGQELGDPVWDGHDRTLRGGERIEEEQAPDGEDSSERCGGARRRGRPLMAATVVTGAPTSATRRSGPA